jgi:hypothetical protein
MILSKVRAWWRRDREPQPGLNTLAEANAFVLAMHAAPAPAPAAIGRATVPLSPLLHHGEPELTMPRVRRRPELARLVAEPVPAVPAWVEGFAIVAPPAPVELTLTRTEAAPMSSVGTPIWDALVAEQHSRVSALRMPTQQMRAVFDSLVDPWLCTHCGAGDCDSCPGCSCSCKMPAAVAA